METENMNTRQIIIIVVIGLMVMTLGTVAGIKIAQKLS